MRDVWRETLRVLEQRLPAKDYSTWIAPIRPSDIGNGAATLEVPNGFFRDWVRQYFMPQLTDALSGASGQPCRVSVVVNPALRTQDALELPFEKPSRPPSPRMPGPRLIGRLIPDHTLENFIVGAANAVAAEAARAVASEPGQHYNPLFVHGGVGVGKTHLLHGIGHAVLAQHGRLRVAAMTAEVFVNAMITALRRDQMGAFRARYRRIDVLIIDDVQFLGGKMRSQAEFFHTFDALRESQRQIVLASDRPPQEIRGLEECLASRFSGGLLAPIAPPDEALRTRIVARKAAALGLELPAELSTFIAGSVRGTVREIQGVLNTLRARVAAGAQAVSRAMVREVLGMLGMRTGGNGPDVVPILEATAVEFGVTVSEILSPSRTARLAEARQAAMFLCRDLTDLPLTVIGQRVGGRDHSTVVYAVGRVTQRIAARPAWEERLDRIRKRVAGRADGRNDS